MPFCSRGENWLRQLLHIEMKVDESRPRQSSGAVKVKPGTTVGDYAIYMEKHKYSLGAGSILKQMTRGPVDTRRVNVGRRYMERAVEYIRKRFPEIAENPQESRVYKETMMFRGSGFVFGEDGVGKVGSTILLMQCHKMPKAP